jgi:hypothetical protein
VVLTPAERGEPRPCQLLGESYDWQASLPGYHHLNIDTKSTDATMLTLPRGVSLLRLAVDRGFYFSCVFRSLTPLVVDKAVDVLPKYDSKPATHEAQVRERERERERETSSVSGGGGHRTLTALARSTTITSLPPRRAAKKSCESQRYFGVSGGSSLTKPFRDARRVTSTRL